MKKSPYIYNNEAISAVVLTSIFKELIEIELTKAMLILPILYHKRTLEFIEQENDNFTLEVFAKKNILLSNFNERFLTYLPITINSLQILQEMQVVIITEKIITFNLRNKLFQTDNQMLGERSNQLISVSKYLTSLLQQEAKLLYKKLGIVL